MSIIYTFTLKNSDAECIEIIEGMLKELNYDILFIGIDVIQCELKISFKEILIEEDETVLINIIKRFII
jgi:hypothetical protein